MPQIITTDLTASANYTVTTGNPDDFIFVAEGVLVSNSSPETPAYSTVGVFHDNTRIGVAGTLLSGNTGVLYSLAANNTVTVAATGSIVAMAAFWNTLDFRAVGARVLNDGSITSLSRAIASTAGDAAVFNTGLISGVIAGVSGATRVENLGTIRGALAVEMGSGEDLLINRGTLVGDVDMGAGEDVFDGVGGTVTGQVRGGTGADVYRVSDAGIQIFDAGTDIDEVQSSVDFSLEFRGALENLVLSGNAVRGTGNVLANLVAGNAMDNRLEGLDGNDTLNGFSGDDILRGGTGRDTLGGGEGDDVILGGRGGDNLTGGADRDVFVFRAVGDLGTTSSTRDVIEDFTPGDDIIDLSAVDARAGAGGNQAFGFIGTAAFTGIGQLRLNTAGGQPMLEGDVTGDGVADFQITLKGVTALTEADLIL